jgi:hypothetical protein
VRHIHALLSKPVAAEAIMAASMPTDRSSFCFEEDLMRKKKSFEWFLCDRALNRRRSFVALFIPPALEKEVPSRDSTEEFKVKNILCF